MNIPQMFAEQKIIFIMGNPRSGGTTMGKILGNNPHVFLFEELHFFQQHYNFSVDKRLDHHRQVALAARLLSIQRAKDLSYKHPLLYVSEAEKVIAFLPPEASPTAVYAAFLAYEVQNAGRTIACDQTPGNILFIREILNLFPNAVILNMVRDPRDVLLSQKNKWHRTFLSQRQKMPITEAIRLLANYHPVTMSLLWNANINSASQYQHDPRVRKVKFEALLENPEKNVNQICRFIGLEYRPEMLLISNGGSSFEIKGSTTEIKRISREPAGRWKKLASRNAADLYICQSICHDNMNKMGYPVEAIRVNPFSVAFAWLMWPVKSSLSFLFNLSRTKNIFRSIQRYLKLAFRLD